MKLGLKAGKLANSFERGKGKVIHVIDTNDDLYFQESLCGERPAIQWCEQDPEVRKVTCTKCLKKMGSLHDAAINLQSALHKLKDV